MVDEDCLLMEERKESVGGKGGWDLGLNTRSEGASRGEGTRLIVKKGTKDSSG